MGEATEKMSLHTKIDENRFTPMCLCLCLVSWFEASLCFVRVASTTGSELRLHLLPWKQLNESCCHRAILPSEQEADVFLMWFLRVRRLNVLFLCSCLLTSLLLLPLSAVTLFRLFVFFLSPSLLLSGFTVSTLMLMDGYFLLEVC